MIIPIQNSAYFHFENRAKISLIIAVALMLLTLPIFQDSISNPFWQSAIMILLLIILAGITQRARSLVVSSGLFVTLILTTVFEYQSIVTYSESLPLLFFANQILAACFAVALYFYVRSLYDILADRIGLGSPAPEVEAVVTKSFSPLSVEAESDTHSTEDFQRFQASLVALRKALEESMYRQSAILEAKNAADFRRLESSLGMLQNSVEESIQRQSTTLEGFMLAELDLKEEQRIVNNRFKRELGDIKKELKQLKSKKRKK